MASSSRAFEPDAFQLRDDLPAEFAEEEAAPVPPPPGLGNDEALRVAYQQYRRNRLKKGDSHPDTARALTILQSRARAFGPPATLDWSTEEFPDGTKNPPRAGDFLERLRSWTSGEKAIQIADTGLNFAATSNNRLDLVVGHAAYHEALFRDLEAARDSIHIQMYGYLADDYGWTLARLLAKKAGDKVKVRVLLDRFGARLTKLNKVPKGRNAGPIQPLLDFLAQSGVEVVLSYDRKTRGLFNYDHRKAYVIDGQIGWSTGYTIETAMRDKIFDQGTRIRGDLVRQLQSTFFASWLAAGGTLPDARADFSAFLARFFPAPEATGTARVNLVMNIPRVQHAITESYYARIANARRRVLVTNLYFADVGFAEALMQAKRNGADVTIIVQEKKDPLYSAFASFYFRKFAKLGIKAYYFHGAEGYGQTHAKAVLADDFVSTGSCNFDLFSLFHNGEQNIESEDAAYVEAVKTQVFDEMLKYSIPYARPKGFFRNLGVTLKGLLSEAYGLVF